VGNIGIMTKICITTERLELIAGTLKIAQAEISDRSQFSQLLDARVPELKSSQRLLEKCQFTNIGQGSEEGSIRFERSRSY
jgi:hypothetical protein